MSRALLLLPLLASLALAEVSLDDAVKALSARDSAHVAIRAWRESALPVAAVVRGEVRSPGAFTGTVASIMNEGDPEAPSEYGTLTVGDRKFVGQDGAAFDPDWLGPILALCADAPRLAAAVWSAGKPIGKGTARQLAGKDILAALAPLAWAYAPVQALDQVPSARTRASIDVDAKDGQVRTVWLRIDLGAMWCYRIGAAFSYDGKVPEPPDSKGWPEALDERPPPEDPDPAKLPEPKAEAISATLARGAEYLLHAQEPDGAWTSAQAREGVGYRCQQVAITAVCLHALVACGRASDAEGRKAIDRGLEALRRLRKERVLEDARVAEGTWEWTPWGSAFGLLHLDGMLARWPKGEKAPDVGDLAKSYLAHALARQKKCGGWHYRDDAKDGSVSFLSAAMVEGLLGWKARGLAVPERALKRAVEDLSKNRDKKGSTGYYHDAESYDVDEGGWTTPESIGRSVQVQWVLLRAGADDKKALQAQLRRFFEGRKHLAAQRGVYPHSPPYFIAGYFYYFAHFWVARALAEADLPAEERAGDRRLLLATLMGEQEEDGSWFDSPAGDRPYATAMAMLAIEALGK